MVKCQPYKPLQVTRCPACRKCRAGVDVYGKPGCIYGGPFTPAQAQLVAPAQAQKSDGQVGPAPAIVAIEPAPVRP